jgi:hypothetical protein
VDQRTPQRIAIAADGDQMDGPGDRRPQVMGGQPDLHHVGAVAHAVRRHEQDGAEPARGLGGAVRTDAAVPPDQLSVPPHLAAGHGDDVDRERRRDLFPISDEGGAQDGDRSVEAQAVDLDRTAGRGGFAQAPGQGRPGRRRRRHQRLDRRPDQDRQSRDQEQKRRHPAAQTLTDPHGRSPKSGWKGGRRDQ